MSDRLATDPRQIACDLIGVFAACGYLGSFVLLTMRAVRKLVY